MRNPLKSKWVLETRPQFLTLSVALVLHGSALAAWQIAEQGGGPFRWGHALLAMVALVLMHGAVDALNDWHDYAKSGIDREIRQTPFSGGSGLVPAGVLSPTGALVLGLGTLAVGTAIGAYLVSVSGAPLLWIGLAGAASIVLYTPVFTRIGLGEIVAGLGLGTLPIVGVYYLLTGRVDAVAWISGIPAGLLTYNLLYLNEFPDAEVDARGGRHHMVILLGKARARWLYAAVEAGTYVAIVVGVAAGVLTPWALLGLGAAFFAVQAIRGALANYDGFESLFPAMGANVMAVLATNVLLALGYLVAALTV
jgi:1,4-dihydroxy-2-naphthoate octaprenyltransferase